MFSRASNTRGALALLLIVPIAAVQAFTTSAGAAVLAGFEIDGNTPVDTAGNRDWATTGTHVPDPVGNADGSNFTEGSKEFDNPSTWVSAPGTSTNQGDVSDVYSHVENTPGASWAFVGFRRYTTQGTITFMVEFNQRDNQDPGAGEAIAFRPDRTVNDLLLRFEQDGNGLFALTTAYKWAHEPATGWPAGCTAVPGYTPESGWCTTSIASAGFDGATGEDKFFAEGAVNLSSFDTVGDCRGAFGVMNVRSFAGNSETSSLKDYIRPIDVEVAPTCGQLQVHKVDQFDQPVGGATFSITPNPVPGVTGTAADELVVRDGGPQDPDGLADGTVTISPARPGTYVVEETIAPTGYLLDTTVHTDVVVGSSGTSVATVEFTDPLVFAPVSIRNVPEATYDVDFDWQVHKRVDRTRADIPEGSSARFTYSVTLEATGRTVSGRELGGTVTLTNPNAHDMVVTLDAAVIGGAACTFPGVPDVGGAAGLQVNLAQGAHPFTYECTPAPAGDGSTQARVGWDPATYPQDPASTPAPTYSRTDVVPYAYTVDQKTDETTMVSDAFDGGTPEVIGGPYTWGDVRTVANSTVTVKTYGRDLSGRAGKCTTYPNTASESADGTTATESVEVCVGRDLVLTKEASMGFHRTYEWDVDKSGPGTVFTGVDGQGQLRRMVQFDIDLSATGHTDSAWRLGGVIKIDNPNDWAMVGTLSDTVVVDTRPLTCTIEGQDADLAATGHQVRVPANAVDEQFTYTCSGVQQGDYVGSNTATITWDQQAYFTPGDSASDTVDVVVDQPTTGNSTITLHDVLDGNDVTADLPQTSFDWATVRAMTGDDTANPPVAPHTQRLTYSVALGTGADRCTPHTNTVSITQTGQADSHTVDVCSPGVDKSFTATFGQKQPWTLTKEVDRTRAEVAQGGSATFHYTVTATPGAVVPDGTASWEGSVRVHNPSPTEPLTVDLSDTPDVAGWTCRFTEQSTGIVLNGGAAADVAYECSGQGHPAGTNTATATFGNQSVSDTVDIEFAARPGVTDSTTTLSDDIPDDGMPALEFPVDASEGVNVFEYDRTLASTAGECRDWTNNAVLALTGDDLTASRTATVCTEKKPTTTISATGSFGRSHDWSIDKAVDRTRVEVDGATGKATFDYTVTVRAGERHAAGWTMGGTLTVANPNTYADGAITLTGGSITSDLGGGVACTPLPGHAIAGTAVPAGGSADIPFECTFTGEPAQSGTVSATVAWDPAGAATTDSVSGSGTATLGVGTETDRTVTVVDDKTDPANPVELGTVTWAEGLVKEFTYSLTHEGTPGECTSYTNTAVLQPAPGAAPASLDDPARTTVTVCVEAPLVAAATAVTADLARTYAWAIDKAVNTTSQTVAAGNATFRYAVTVKAGAATDSGWQLGGTITVTNPNTYGEGAVTLTGTDIATDVGGGASCVASAAGDRTVPPGGSLQLPFTCTFTGAPARTGSMRADVSWDPAGVAGTATARAGSGVAFALRSETNKVVDVVDDKTVPGQRTVLQRGLAWAPGLTRTYAYDLALAGGAAGSCRAHTNTATVDLPTGTDPTDTMTVQVCLARPEVLPAESFGKARGAVRATCQGTVTARMKNATGERVTYKLRIGKRKAIRINVRSGNKRLFQTKGPARARVQLKVGRKVLDRVRIPRRCLPPEVLPETGLRAATNARLVFLTEQWR